ncbi:unnamed protein product [Dovyalis caffra]|uniref:B-like cyclin n=1 Tax=Dovyalis caffra TaxID=77055 RepID=A0AAV1R7U0_9ROSI|nr:unnamed protein product [Dovyalis caffra]
MGGSNENNPGLFVPLNLQEGTRMGNSKFAKDMGQNQRRPLSSINQNIIGAALYPSVVNERDKSGDMAAEMETEKSTTLELKPSSYEDCSIIEVEEYDGAAIPMFVKHTEAMLDEIDRMEVEMEDAEDSIVDIDNGDLKDPSAVVEYIDDIYAYYKKTEGSGCVSPTYMDRQFDINQKMRAILIDWLIEVHYKFELMDETLFLTINLIDRFLERCTVVRKKLQLVGVTAMLIACKYEEVSVPVVDDFVLISDKAYTRKEVLDMEKLMVNTLQFNMSLPTPYMFIKRFLKAALSDMKPLPNDIDLLNPPAELEKRKHKLKRLVQSPNSFFMNYCFQSLANCRSVWELPDSVVPTNRGRAKLTEGCSFRKKSE